MKNIDWQKIMKRIMGADTGRNDHVMTYPVISKKTGIGISTLSRLATQSGRKLDYDAGVKLMKLHDDLLKSGKIQK